MTIHKSHHFASLVFSFYTRAFFFNSPLFLLLSRLRSVRFLLRRLVLELGSAFVAVFISFFSFSPFFLKKLTRNTPNNDSINPAPFPSLNWQFKRILSYFSFDLKRTSKGQTWSCPSFAA